MGAPWIQNLFSSIWYIWPLQIPSVFLVLAIDKNDFSKMKQLFANSRNCRNIHCSRYKIQNTKLIFVLQYRRILQGCSNEYTKYKIELPRWINFWQFCAIIEIFTVADTKYKEYFLAILQNITGVQQWIYNEQNTKLNNTNNMKYKSNEKRCQLRKGDVILL